MSKQMKSAYSALRMKDMLIAVIEEFKTPMLILCAIALLCFGLRPIFLVASFVCAVWIALRGLIVVLNWRMHLLGFDEVKLERLALA